MNSKGFDSPSSCRVKENTSYGAFQISLLVRFTGTISKHHARHLRFLNLQIPGYATVIPSKQIGHSLRLYFRQADCTTTGLLHGSKLCQRQFASLAHELTFNEKRRPRIEAKFFASTFPVPESTIPWSTPLSSCTRLGLFAIFTKPSVDLARSRTTPSISALVSKGASFSREHSNPSIDVSALSAAEVCSESILKSTTGKPS